MKVRYPATRHNQKTMLMIVNTHTFLPEPARAASWLSCRQTAMHTRLSSGCETALATRLMR
jgi:hypothetical protein